MRISILAAGRFRQCPEQELMNRYLSRFEVMARHIGVRSLKVIEYEETGRKTASHLLERLGRGCHVVGLDERGTQHKSSDFAQCLHEWRAREVKELYFIIGGAEGHGPHVKERMNETISLGKMVWPHGLVRAMLAEQLYRAATYLTNHPYHKE